MEKIILKNKNILFSVDNILEGDILKKNIEKHLKMRFKEIYYIADELVDKRNLYKILRETLGKSNKRSLFYKIYNKYSKKLIYDKLKKYKNLDYFFILNEGNFSKDSIYILRKLNKNIKIILFLWDKLELTDYRDKYQYFDYIYSFDREDCQKYGFNFRPSFFIDECQKNTKEYNKREFDLYYICSLREMSRYRFTEKLFKYCQTNKLKSYLKVYSSNKKDYLQIKNLNKNLILNNKISYIKNLEKIKNSKVVVDLKYQGQTGLTLRCYEALATKTKVITTNEDIKNYDFYNEKNIKIIHNIKEISNIDKNFFLYEYEPIGEAIKYKYSLDGFLEEIFQLDNSKENKFYIKIIKNSKRSKVMYNFLKKEYIKEFSPKFQKKIKYFFKLEEYPGYNFKKISNLLDSLNIKTPEIRYFSKYKVITKEIQGKSLSETLKGSSNEESKKYIEEYVNLIRKLIDNRVYFADYSCDNFYIHGGEIYALDLEDYRSDFLFNVRKKKMFKVMKEKIRTIPKESLDKLDIKHKDVIKKILEKRRNEC